MFLFDITWIITDSKKLHSLNTTVRVFLRNFGAYFGDSLPLLYSCSTPFYKDLVQMFFGISPVFFTALNFFFTACTPFLDATLAYF